MLLFLSYQKAIVEYRKELNMQDNQEYVGQKFLLSEHMMTWHVSGDMMMWHSCMFREIG
jgi:hypothetical protein